jgi:predicted N-acetyltransferase YhbS
MVSIASKLTTLVVPYASDEYQAALRLRESILRQPLGLKLTEEDLRRDKKSHHIVAKLEDEVIACLILSPTDDGWIQMRQVAVSEAHQRQGVGQALIEDAEFFARESGYKRIFCKARDTAVPFYLKLGYEKAGQAFTSLGIQHWRMEKMLT